MGKVRNCTGELGNCTDRVCYISTRKTLHYTHAINHSDKERNKMLKTELAVKAIGQPSIQALSESEQRTFFETLFANILKLSNNQSKGA